MADEELAVDGTALETPASGAEQQVDTPEIETEGDELEVDTEGGEDDAEQDDTDELEFGFKKYRVPKELKAAVEDWRSSTTKKEQEIAERARALEAQSRQQVEASEAELSARAELFQVNKTLEEYSKLTQADWDAHEANDPQRTQQAWRQYQMLKDQKAELEGKVSKAQSERAELAQSDLTKRIQETLEYASKSTSGLKPETIPKIVEFAEQMSIPAETIKQLWSPTFAEVLHFARIGKMASEKQKTAPRVAAPTAEAKPIVPVTAKGSAPKVGLRDDLSTEEWVRRRNAEIKKRA